ncbi:type IV toxin-antitoxin system AbiEi family antitoxin [Cellulosimicrobium cellulans]|uniref:type IV toxin-antitoxin system AbiEi family antitoxin domain-containing protein n=1 Tax=Cellulosimicrobium cellulans TaxID=1710 RepID=UPI00130DDFAA|nr:type IV toxin-antitoxin system AbiEi family antitoxin [Cellulosimicrobium cellulans]
MDVLRAVAAAPSRTVRPSDLAPFYTNPRAGVQDLERRGWLHRLAYGYYCGVPLDADPATWRPSLEAAAAAVARTPAEVDEPVLMGLTAARVHGAVPRALGTAWVAVTAARRPLRLADRDAEVRFVRRSVATLDAERVVLDLGAVLVTTPEQTLLDLARPATADPEHVAVARALSPLADQAVLADLATRTRAGAALDRVRRWVS